MSQADLLDENRVPGIGQHDHITGGDVTSQDYGLPQGIGALAVAGKTSFIRPSMRHVRHADSR